MEKVEQNKLNSMLDESLSKETAESWNERLQKESDRELSIKIIKED